jgi:hypothetical protein
MLIIAGEKILEVTLFLMASIRNILALLLGKTTIVLANLSE